MARKCEREPEICIPAKVVKVELANEDEGDDDDCLDMHHLPGGMSYFPTGNGSLPVRLDQPVPPVHGRTAALRAVPEAPERVLHRSHGRETVVQANARGEKNVLIFRMVCKCNFMSSFRTPSSWPRWHPVQDLESSQRKSCRPPRSR